MKKNNAGHFTHATEGFRTYANDGFNKATSNKPRPPKPKLGKDAFKSETFLSMIGEQKKTI
ncbi:MAG: hypothetical protein J6P19_00175 [Acetobacter sp.]|nr:hypothetical protein [Acetobacter sp.]